MKTFLRTLLIAMFLIPGLTIAEDVYYGLSIDELNFIDGNLPTYDLDRRVDAIIPYATLDNEGEAYLDFPFSSNRDKNPIIRICAPKNQEVTGNLYLPKLDQNGMIHLRFSVPSTLVSMEKAVKNAFYKAKVAHYFRLVRKDIPGAAWFRYQERQARLQVQPLKKIEQADEDRTEAVDSFLRGVVRGQVMSTRNAQPIPRVRVVVGNTRSGEFESVTDRAGEFRVVNLPPGSYLISIHRAGFSDREGRGRSVTVIAGGEHYISLFMSPRGAGFAQARRTGRLEDTYALFSGGRAMSENLQLDRELDSTGTEAATIDVDSLEGISIQEMDWQSVIQDAKPELDPLARLIPADQHALFFPNFQALVRLIDEVKLQGIPVLQLAEPRSEDAQTLQRYEKQLCLALDSISRLLGATVIDSVAFTGSDPYLRTGSDVAVLFETQKPSGLKMFLEAKYAATLQTHPDTENVSGEVDGTAYTGLVSPDRVVCSYFVILEHAVIVTNSLHQLTQIVHTAKGVSSTLASLPEYAFFRSRYHRNDETETGLLILTDATIRRWCGPRWRIGASRRTRVAAVMADLQAQYLNDLIAGNSRPVETDLQMPDAGELSLTAGGVTSSVYGNLNFLTPIAELSIDKVTNAEESAYNRWRNRYQRQWRQFFDPIALRFSIESEKIGSDLTVMPLIEGTDYRQFIDITKGAKIVANAGDRHPETLLHIAVAINLDAALINQGSNMARALAPGLSTNPLGWLGDSISVYLDDDPIWAELKSEQDFEQFMENGGISRLPIAVHFAVNNPLGVTAFLTILRVFMEQTSNFRLRFCSTRKVDFWT